ncbi:MAG: hypothetical protein KHX03_09720 [Clostridium sp.]|nr:hypothetical protein [Clostridium sp.]
MQNTAKVIKNSGQFKKGQTKPANSGRKKGTPNKKTAEIFERLKGVDIVGELLAIARTTEKDELKVAVYKELMKYVYPQRKAVALGINETAGINIVVADKKHKEMLEEL